MLKPLLSYIWGYKEEDNSLEEAFEILSKPEEKLKTVKVPETQVEANNTTSHRIGYVTKIDNGNYIIDDKYSFKFEEDIPIGTKVSFIIYRDKYDLKITNVTPIHDDWDLAPNATENLWCVRKIVGKVYKREQRNFYVNPGEIKVDLNNTTTEFIPMVGDWVELETKSEIDENVTNLSGNILEIIKISPLRIKIVHGTVTCFNNQTFIGNINNEYYFDRECLNQEYIPKYRDKVIAEVIESNQMNFNWRAIKVVLHNQSIDKTGFSLNQSNSISYRHNVEGVSFSENFTITSNTINEIKMFSIHLRNEREENLEFVGVKFESNFSQIKLKNKLEEFTLKKGEDTYFEFLVKFKSYGDSKELIIFLFKEFNIGRFVHVNLSANNFNFQSSSHKNSNVKALMRNHRSNSNNIIRGEHLAAPVRFMVTRIGVYNIPNKLWDVYLNYDYSETSKTSIYHDLVKMKPCLNANLSFRTYEDTFHTLLYIEEIQQVLALRKFDQERACFIRNGEYLMLEIENLAEKRPSIIIGDKIIATSPLNLKTSFEGVVHKVSGHHLYLKFCSVIHESYNGEDYKIHVVASRTQFRRLHHAITSAARNLTQSFLFPSKIFSRKPQTTFIYDKYDDIIDTTNQKLKDRTVLCKSNNQIYKDKAEGCPINESKIDISTIKIQNNEVQAKHATKLLKPLVESKQDSSIFKLEWYDKSLNYFQKEAVRNILLGEARPLPYVIFGPPGTGKTVTVVETILQLLRMVPHSRILVATPSNSASDLIALRLIDSNVIKPGDLVRLVAYKLVATDSIPLRLIPYSATCSVAREGTGINENQVTASGLTLGCSASVLGRHRITIGTCSALSTFHTMAFKLGHFTHIFIDEAGQCTEPESMVPITFLDINEGQIILAGDPMQLGPSVLSQQAKDLGLDESYLIRILNRFPYIRDIQGFPKTGGYDPRLVTKLLYNYRSLPGMLTVPNRLFYHSELRPTISETDSEEYIFLKQFEELLPVKENKIPCLVFHGINGTNYQTDDCPSWFNPDEASQIFFYLNELYRLGAKCSDIAVITPYIKQVKQLNLILREAEFDLPKVGTVEEFQGQEFNIVLLSTVRSSSDLVKFDLLHSVGFISSPKRLNVALTRGKCLTIIVGNPRLLYNESHWRAVITHCVEAGAYIGCEI